MDKPSENAKKGHKPAKNHPWRNAASAEVVKWAAETTTDAPAKTWVVGSGRDPWNKQ